MKEQIKMMLVGKTEAGNAEVQPARDSRLKATNCRWGGSLITAISYNLQRQFRALQCLKKPNKTAPPKAASVSAKSRKSLKTKSGFVQFTLNQYKILFLFNSFIYLSFLHDLHVLHGKTSLAFNLKTKIK